MDKILKHDLVSFLVCVTMVVSKTPPPKLFMPTAPYSILNPLFTYGMFSHILNLFKLDRLARLVTNPLHAKL